jgi:hypothetical protein
MAEKNCRRLHVALPLLVFVKFLIFASIHTLAAVFRRYGGRGLKLLAAVFSVLPSRQAPPGINKMPLPGLCLLLLAACTPFDNYMPQLREVHLQNGLRFSLPENWESGSGVGNVEFYAEAFCHEQEARSDLAVLRLAVIRAPHSLWAGGVEERQSWQYLRVIEQNLRQMLTLPAIDWDESVCQQVNNLTLLRFSYHRGEFDVRRDHCILYIYGREYIISLDFSHRPFIRRQVDMFINSLYFSENG